MQLFLISGLSGSGKSVALKVLEDSGYYCVDNLPVEILPALMTQLELSGYMRIAVSIDVRSGSSVKQLPQQIEQLKHQGVEDKWAAMQKLLTLLNLAPDVAAYMGDDVVDLPVMRRMGLSITVPNAPQVVRDHAHYLTQREGGHGAVREACELIMSAQGTLDAQLAPYLS